MWYNVENANFIKENIMDNDKKNLFKILKNFSKKIKIALSIAISLLLVAIICLVTFAPSGDTTVSVRTSLKEVFENSELSTSEYTYNSIVAVPIDSTKPAEEDNLKCQVAYKGTAKYGFDFKKIEIVEKDNSLLIIIPKIEITDINVDENLDYIFTKNKYDKENTYAEVINACCKDLEDKANNNKTLYNTAIKSAIETVTAITKPFEKQLDDGKTLQILYIDDYKKEAK